MNTVKTYPSGTTVRHPVVCVEVRPGKWVIEFCDEGSETVEDTLNQSKSLGMAAKKVFAQIIIPISESNRDKNE